ncbi:MAG TPA: lysophospholipid acyltransferase family protein [Thermoanaerobaculia bacterium]|nr:lysophospholipid acyltransferase family protein [Thermoanaerobaculia bacterium]
MEKPRRRFYEWRPLAVPLSYLWWLLNVVIVLLWAPFMGVFRLLTRHSDPGRHRIGRILRNAGVVGIKLNPFWDFRVVDTVHPDARRPYLFVSNHRSMADIWLLSMLPWEMKFLSKEAVFHIWVLGWEMKLAGDIPLERGDKASARRAMREMRQRLIDKSSMVVFPEGTRSADGRLGRFREGTFRLAIDLGVDIVPLAIAGTETALPKHSMVFQRTTATVEVLPPVSVAGMTAADAPALAERVRREIARALHVELVEP